MDLDEYRAGLDAWLEHHAEALAPAHEGKGTLDEQLAQIEKVKRLAFDAGWMRHGWPERVGGLGGSTLLRAYLQEAVTARDLVEPGLFSMQEVLAPTMIDFASPELGAIMVPRLLRGDETWCQGFSEPGTGSNLASLACRAVRDGDTWRVTGQKVWTSLAQYAERCVLLTRTGTVESAHRGITGLFVDMDSPGITVRPIEAVHGSEEFSEVFFDDVVVPAERMLGAEGQGWSVAMDLLPYERSTALWQRAAFLHRRLQQLLELAPADSLDPVRLGEVTQTLYAFRARSRATQHRMADGGTLGPETSIDKVLLATTEQAVFDLFADALAAELTTGDDPASSQWRAEFLYSRAASIYGGSSEIQRNIIARRLLDLGSDR
ncbi:acyl-CoA dehydrogenase family protein [Rhabdothermincola salaria]|uniref:acyl-CoA dehydrogenase family protein n=1 Tax=Rhabdothermincola salaria TaxID=2903142 RepID=UPI001E508B3B|nr:acyl-CoA dehydrogenase family protein [Rhabdothermincola salaria]MCD9624725.1 acyl-CoA dehydrogenase family protein [Rhabdothermincola salaria]